MRVERFGSSNDPAGLQQFAAAMIDPFSEKCNGVRMPDQFSFPTATCVARGKYTLVGDGSVSAVKAVAFLPNPLLSAFDLSYFNTSQPAIFNSSGVQYPVNQFLWGITSPANLKAKLADYRLVAGGIRVRVQWPEQTRSGTITFAPIPMQRDVPGYIALQTQALNPAGSGATAAILGGMTPGAAGATSILELPGAFQMSLCDMGREDVILPFRPISAAVEEFKLPESANAYSASYNWGTETLSSNATGLVQVNDTANTLNGPGWNGWLVVVDGLPVGSNAIATCEYVYHMEGCPLSGTGAGSLTTGVTGKTLVNTAGYHKVLDFVSALPWGRVVDAGLSHFGLSGAALGATQKMIRQMY